MSHLVYTVGAKAKELLCIFKSLRVYEGCSLKVFVRYDPVSIGSSACEQTLKCGSREQKCIILNLQPKLNVLGFFSAEPS